MPPPPIEPAGLTEDGAAAVPLVPVEVAAVEVELPDPYALVVLAEVGEGARTLAIPMALADANALAHAWRGVGTPRPLTHELFAEVLVRLGATVEVVRLLGRRDGVVLAELELCSPGGRERIPCRPSDGLTLALRQRVRAPIVANPALFEPEVDVEPPDDPLSRP